MSVDFKNKLKDLRILIAKLQQRCLQAETHAEELDRQLGQEKVRVSELEAENKELLEKYKSLQASATLMNGSNADIDALRRQYLEMVNLIDGCIAKLEHRG